LHLWLFIFNPFGVGTLGTHFPQVAPMAIYIQPLWGWHFDKVSTKSVIIRRNPIFWEKSDFSNRAQGAIDLRFLRKIEFFKPCPNVPKKFFGKNRISQTVPKVPKKFLGKIGFLLKWSGLEIFAFVYYN
jgi:hypothetical protein